MLREIKFRQFDKSDKSFHHWGFVKDGFVGPQIDARMVSVPSEQFTGLKDKNGREIYEGDILKHDLWGITKVVYDNLRAGYGAIKADSDEFDCGLGNHQLQRTRVIGNIHENPELLK